MGALGGWQPRSRPESLLATTVLCTHQSLFAAAILGSERYRSRHTPPAFFRRPTSRNAASSETAPPAASGSLDAPGALLVYFLQRHATFRSQYEPLPCPGCRCVRPRNANYEPQCARGKRSLTNRIFELRTIQATTPQARLVAFSLAALSCSILVGQFSTQLYLLQIALVRA